MGAEYVLLPAQPKFVLGSAPSPICDICVERRHISYSHALLERRNGRVRISDLSSKNGLVYRGERLVQFEIGPGDQFAIDETVFYALNDEMRMGYPVLAEILGVQPMEAIDDLLIEAVRGGHVLLRAEPGGDQERLARVLHRVSLRRTSPFVVATAGAEPGAGDEPTSQLVAHARNGTMLLRLDAVGARLDPTFVETLLRPESNVRLILCARSLKEAIDLVTEAIAGSAHRVEISPVRARSGDIASLLERWFVDRCSQLRFSDFAEANQAALRSYRWPGNLEEVRDVADLLIRLAPYASERKAAMHVDVPRTSLKRLLDDIKLALPLLRTPASEPSK